METMNFEKELLSYNAEGFESTLNNLTQTCDELNQEIESVQTQLKETFTAKQRKEIKADAYKFLVDFITTKKPFADASLDFNLQAMGLTSMHEVLERWRNKTNVWQSLPLELNKELLFEISVSEIQNLKETFKRYTETPAQKERLKIVNELLPLINKAVSMGMISPYNRPTIANCILGVKVGVEPNESEYSFVIDPHNI